MSLVTPVSGFQNTILISGDPDVSRAFATLTEMDRIEYAFESFRSQINSICVQHPQHSVFPQVLSLVETMIGPVIADNPALQSTFVESVKSTVSSFMPWDKFLEVSAGEPVNG